MDGEPVAGHLKQDLQIILPSSSNSSWISVKGRPSSLRTSGSHKTWKAAYLSSASCNNDVTFLMFCCTSVEHERSFHTC